MMQLWPTIVAFVVPVLPLVLAAALFVPGCSALALRLSPWVPITGLGLLALHGEVVALPWLLLGARVGLDNAALPLLVLASVVWTIAGLHGRYHLPAERREQFFLFWLITWTGNLCVFVMLDAAGFYTAYAVMTYAAYGLIIFNGQSADYRAGRVYLAMAVVGDALIIVALIMTGAELGNLALGTGQAGLEQLKAASPIVWLLIFGFGVKMGLIGLHVWLPLAHPQAPVPASAVLSGVIIKAGLMGWLRFLPLGAGGFELPGRVLMGVGLLTAFYAIAIGLFQTRVKTVLAYSSVSQMGLVSVAVGLALLHPESAPLLITVATFFALHHGLAKATLFLSVDIVRSTPRLARALMWWPALAIAGAPLTSGALAKVAMKMGMGEGPPWLTTALLLSTVATALLMARFLWLVWPADADRRPVLRGTVPWITGVFAVVVLPWLVAATMQSELALKPFEGRYLLETTLPLLITVLLALAACRLLRDRRLLQIPEGDLIALLPKKVPTSVPSIARPAITRLLRRLRTKLSAGDRALARLTPALFTWMIILALAFWFLR